MKAYELIEQYGWCQGAWAKTEKGHQTKYTSDNACTFCLAGAIYRCYPREDVDVMFERVYKTLSILDRPFWGLPNYGAWLVQYNDEAGRTKEEILDVLRKADV